MGVVNPERVIIACQGSPTKKFLKQMENLFKTLDVNGGQLKKAKRLACFSEDINPELTSELTKLHVRIKKVDSIDSRHIISNKIQMLLLDEYNDDYDYLAALDSDIVINKDFSHYFRPDGIGAALVRHSENNLLQWEKFFQFFGFELPEKIFYSSINRKEIPPYFNSGVLLIPRQYIKLLYDKWKEFILKLIESFDQIPDNKESFSRIDQLALSLAIIENKFPYYELPVSINFPHRGTAYPNFNPKEIEPYIIHYHKNFNEDGTLVPSPYPNINKIIDRLNFNIRNF